MKNKVSIEVLTSLCKRRGFLFQSSEIYGGLQGVYDYGPLGVEIKNNLKMAWWKAIVHERDDIEGLDASILTHRLVLKYSGHEETFSDWMVDCRDCKHRMRKESEILDQCDHCGSKNLTEPRQFNLMLETALGPLNNSSSLAYLRPETAQGIFTNFKHIMDTTSQKIPFGVAQIGKAFRNEITPKNFIFRVREFEQMELEFFVEPGTDDQWHAIWVKERYDWWIKQGLSKERLKLHHQTGSELAHYAKATTDLLYEFPFGFAELEGIANRSDFDLGSHSKSQEELHLVSKVKPNNQSTALLALHNLEKNRTTVPFVIEPSAGLDRGVLAILTEAYTNELLENGQSRIVMRFKPHLAPIKVAVIPLAKNNEKIVNKAKEIKRSLQKLSLGRIRYEDIGNVGKAYRRHDEIGTPLCITVDFDTFEGKEETITVRDRDSMKQIRMEISKLPLFLKDYFF